MAENTSVKQRGRQWKKGESGNPQGRPRGSLNKATLAAQSLLDGEAEALTRKAVELALQGDVFALRLCLDRILAARKERPVSLELPEMKTAGGVADALLAITHAVVDGTLTPSEGTSLAAIVQKYAEALADAPKPEAEDAVEVVSRTWRWAGQGRQPAPTYPPTPVPQALGSSTLVDSPSRSTLRHNQT